MTKPERIDQARAIFRGTGVVIQLDGSKDQLTQVGAQGVEIVTTGARHLGAAVGTLQYKHTYISKKVEAWVGAVKTLADIAMTEPQAAFAAYTHCLQSQWTFLCRTMPGTPELFQPLEDAIRKVFIAKLFRRDVSERERDLLSLPARLGGMGITKPTEEAAIASANSMYVSDPLVRLVARQEFALDPTALLDQIKKLRRDVDRRNDERHAQKRKVVLTDAPRDIIVAMDISSDKGSSNWVTAYPSYERHTDLSKGEFTDAVCMRYGWPIANIDTVCACGTNFSVEHALNCQYGGLRAIQHNEVRDVVGQCMKDASYAHVEIEPRLQELSGEVFQHKTTNREAEARSDVKCKGFWSKERQAYFDIKVVNPFARSYSHLTPAALFNQAERTKEREYGERIRRVDHGDFTPLVFTCTGGMAPESQMVIKRLAERMSTHLKQPRSVKCRLSFALLRTTLLCIRATRRKRFIAESTVELDVNVAHIEH